MTATSTPAVTKLNPPLRFVCRRLAGSSLLAWVTAGWVAALGVAGLVLAGLNQVSIRQALGEFFVATMAAALSFGAVGVLIAAKRPGERMAWLCCGAAIALVISPFAAQYARHALLTHPGSLPAGQVAAWVADWVWPLGYGLVLVGMPLLFPTGRPPSARWRPVAWVASAAIGLGMVGGALSPAANPDLPEVANPYGVPSARTTAAVLSNLGMVALASAAVAAVVSIVVRYRHSTGRERDQLRWLIFAAAVLAVTQAGVPLGGLAAGIASNPSILGYAQGGAAPLLALAIGVAILRHRLYDIDLWVNRTLVYATMTALVVGAYVIVVGYLGSELDARGTWAGLAAAAVVAVLFHPVQERVQRAVNRVLYGKRDEPYAALVELGHRLEATLSPGSVLVTITDAVRDALRVPYARVEIDGDVRAESGSATSVEIGARVPLFFGAERVGELAVANRRPGESLGPGDQRLLSDFARQAGAAVHAVALAAQLQTAHQRLIAARQEERRRLRRDLHDGLGPHLASQPLTLDAARAMLRADPDGADALLAELRGQTQQAVAAVRQVVHDLRPDALDDGGLLAALRHHTTRYAATGLQVTVDAPAALPDLPTAVEVAAYRIVNEAVANAARHAGATRCVITVSAGSGVLRAQVRDDGRGIPANHQPGVGLSSMRERATELGGDCRIASTPGLGTCVTVSLPLVAASPA